MKVHQKRLQNLNKIMKIRNEKKKRICLNFTCEKNFTHHFEWYLKNSSKEIILRGQENFAGILLEQLVNYCTPLLCDKHPAEYLLLYSGLRHHQTIFPPFCLQSNDIIKQS